MARTSSRSVGVMQKGQRPPRFAAILPVRRHTTAYHEPLLLWTNDGTLKGDVGRELLEWYAEVATQRGMPWRKRWIDPQAEEFKGSGGSKALRKQLEKRAYEVWISEIMLQQTRVATVISYWSAWTSKWPTVQDLARASPEDVLAMWRGLGYYSRATRIHQAAKKISDDAELNGLLPESAVELQKQVPGVGKYTAGAISSIVFGRAEAILDGNVARVLSRQLAYHANPKNKATSDFLWDAAQRIVEAVAGHSRDGGTRSEKPSFWNQALMELGSTICTPQQPKCGECPVKSSCRAFAEGEQIAMAKGEMQDYQAIHPVPLKSGFSADLGDIEDICAMCEPYEGSTQDVATVETTKDYFSAASGSGVNKRKDSPTSAIVGTKKVPKQASLILHLTKATSSSRYIRTQQHDNVAAREEKYDKKRKNIRSASGQVPPLALSTIQSHVSLYPMKAVKSQIRDEECCICVIRITVGAQKRWLLEQRPDKGLLASLWEFPTLSLAKDAATTTKARTKAAIYFVERLLQDLSLDPRNSLSHLGEVGQLTHIFSHLKLKMYVHSFTFDSDGGQSPVSNVSDTCHPSAAKRSPPRKWANVDQVEAESMGTGMRNCWSLVKPREKPSKAGSVTKKSIQQKETQPVSV